MDLKYKPIYKNEAKIIRLNRKDLQYYKHDIHFLPSSSDNGLFMWAWRIILPASPCISMGIIGIKIDRL